MRGFRIKQRRAVCHEYKGVSTTAELPEFEALKAVYDYRISERRFLMERQFAATIQAVTLNVIVTGASFAARNELPPWVRWLVLVLLLLFNVEAIVYLFAKKHSYNGVRDGIRFMELEFEKYNPRLANVRAPDPPNSTTGRILTFLGDGTNIFRAVIVFAAFCSIIVYIYAQPSSEQEKANKTAQTKGVSDASLGNMTSSAGAK